MFDEELGLSFQDFRDSLAVLTVEEITEGSLVPSFGIAWELWNGGKAHHEQAQHRRQVKSKLYPAISQSEFASVQLGGSMMNVLLNYPRDVYFVGNLRPVPSASNRYRVDPSAPAWIGELLNKLAPVAFGAEFLVKTTDSEVESRSRAEMGLLLSCVSYVLTATERHQLSLQREQNSAD